MSGRLLRRALEIVSQRESQYGHPSEHWKVTAAIATALLGRKLLPGERVTEDDWGRLMIGDKLARDLGPDPRIDQLVDIAGYADGISRLRGDSDAVAVDTERRC